MTKSLLFVTIRFFLVALGFVAAQGEENCVIAWSEEDDGIHMVCEVCGNGIEESQEGCDDGNTIAGDGCSSTCKVEMDAPMLLEVGPQDEQDWVQTVTPSSEQILPPELLGAGPSEAEIMEMNPNAQWAVAYPSEMQDTGAPTIRSLLAARNIKQAWLAQSAKLWSNITLPNQLAPTGAEENLIALLVILFGSVGVWASLKFIK